MADWWRERWSSRLPILIEIAFPFPTRGSRSSRTRRASLTDWSASVLACKYGAGPNGGQPGRLRSSRIGRACCVHFGSVKYFV